MTGHLVVAGTLVAAGLELAAEVKTATTYENFCRRPGGGDTMGPTVATRAFFRNRLLTRRGDSLAPRPCRTPSGRVRSQLGEQIKTEGATPTPIEPDADSSLPGDPALSKEVEKVVKKTAATFAPRASTKSRNPAVPGSMLYSVFEVQGYASMALGGLLSFNLLFPSQDPDIWRLMGMWSVWMFTIPSLRARDCTESEKSALNYLFLVVPLVNVTLPLFWKSFAAVWTADVVTFFAFYAWKMGWLGRDAAGGS